MIKRLCIFFIFASISSFLFSIDWQTELKNNFVSETSIKLGGYEGGNLYKREGNKLKIKYNLDYGDSYDELTDQIGPYTYQSTKNIFEDFLLKNDGFLYGKIANEPFSSKPVKEVPMIFGDVFNFSIPSATYYFKIGSEGYKKWLYSDGSYEKKQKTRGPDTSVFNDLIIKVQSSSHLIENNKGIEFDYSGVNLDWFLVNSGREWSQDGINPYCFPWVENAKDSGIDEWIEFELNSPQSITYILNGFVDGNRIYLYKANSRMKEAEFTSWTESGKEIRQNVHFEDFVYFKTVQFSEPVTKFRITIKETYPGEKWQDTAISAVMFPAPILEK